MKREIESVRNISSLSGRKSSAMPFIFLHYQEENLKF